MMTQNDSERTFHYDILSRSNRFSARALERQAHRQRGGERLIEAATASAGLQRAAWRFLVAEGERFQNSLAPSPKRTRAGRSERGR